VARASVEHRSSQGTAGETARRRAALQSSVRGRGVTSWWPGAHGGHSAAGRRRALLLLFLQSSHADESPTARRHARFYQALRQSEQNSATGRASTERAPR